MKRRYAVLAGDGIGVDVTREAFKVVEAAARRDGFTVEIESFPYSAEHYLSTGETLPDDALETLKGFDAIFMGAFGDPRVPDMAHARDILLGTRFKLDQFINLRPVRCVTRR